MNPERAIELIERERTRNEDVVMLARHLAIAVRIELELLRAMRLGVMPWADPGVEADLYFSPLVMARDVSAMALIPEVRAALTDELALHQDELANAVRIVERAHGDMDAVILLEELTTSDALRGNRDAYRSMQRRLGTLVRELERSDHDPDVLYWTADALDRLPSRARASDAGRDLRRLVNHKLGGEAAVATSESATTESTRLGFRASSDGVAVRGSVEPGWQDVDVPGPLPLDIEVGWPIPGGWESRMVHIENSGSRVEIADVPLGLVRIRSMNGDDVRLRIEGPFNELKPTLLRLSFGTQNPLSSPIADEAEDMDWRFDSEWLESPGSNRVFVVGAGEKASEVARDIVSRLTASGLDTWSDRSTLEAGDDWQTEIKKQLESFEVAVLVLSPGLTSNSADWELTSVLERARESLDVQLYVLLVGLESLEDPALQYRSDLFDDIRQHRLSHDPDEVVEAIVNSRAEASVDLASCDAFVLSFGSAGPLSRFTRSLEPLRRSGEHLTPQLRAIIDTEKPVVVRAESQTQAFHGSRSSQYGNQKVAQEDRYQQFARLLDRLSHELAEQRYSSLDGSTDVLRREMLRGEQQAIAGWLARNEEPQRVPTDPPHVMVLIQWDNWFPPDRSAPIRFHTYRSKQKRLVNLVGDGGTVWVIASRLTSDGTRRYRLAYRLEHVESTTAEPSRDGVFEVAAAPSNTSEFPEHDATDFLLRLEFTSGTPMEEPGDIGRRLQSIPQLTQSDLEELTDFVDGLGEAAGTADTVRTAMVFYTDEYQSLAEQVAKRLGSLDIDVVRSIHWDDSEVMGVQDAVDLTRAIHCLHPLREDADRVRDKLSDLVDLRVSEHVDWPDVFERWGDTEPEISDIQILLAEPAADRYADFERSADAAFGDISRLHGVLDTGTLPFGSRINEGIAGLLKAQETAVSALLGAREELSSERGSFDFDETEAILEDIGSLTLATEDLLEFARSGAHPPIVSRTRTRALVERHAQFSARNLRGANQPLRLVLGRSIEAFRDAVSQFYELIRIPLVYSSPGSDMPDSTQSKAERNPQSEKLSGASAPATRDIVDGIAEVGQAVLGSYQAAVLEPVEIADEKAIMEVLSGSDVIFLFATEEFLQAMARDEAWLDAIYGRANSADLFVLPIGYGVRDRWEHAVQGSRASQDFIHLDETLLFADDQSMVDKAPSESARPPRNGGVSLEYLEMVLSEPIERYAKLLFDADAVLEALQPGASDLAP